MTRRVLVLSALLLCLGADGAETNLLQGIPAQFETAPNYDLTDSPSDPSDLTDGETKVGEVWFHKSCVGWKGTHCGALFDLGREVSGGRLRLHVSWGRWVTEPERIYVLVSKDNVNYALVDEILRHKDYPAFNQEVGIAFWVESRELNRRFRYVRFVAIPSRPIGHFYCDEVELTPGAEDAPAVGAEATYPAGELAFVNHLGYLDRIREDCEAVRANARALDVPCSIDILEGDFMADLDAATALLGDDNAFPLNRAQRQLADENQRVLAAAGYKDIVFSWVPRYEPNNAFTLPTPYAQPEVLRLYPGERRYFAFNLSNPKPEETVARVQIDATLPVRLWKAVATVSPRHFFNANRLEELPVQEGAIALTLLPGETAQVFGAVTAVKGVEKPSVTFTLEDGAAHRLPLRLGRAWEMPSSFSAKFCMWDFLSALDAEFAQGRGNLQRLLELMRENRLDWTWLSDAQLPLPEAALWEGADYKGELDFSNIDRWLALMGGQAEYFCLYLGAHRFNESNFGLKPAEDFPLFKARLKTYVARLADYLKGHCNLPPEKVIIHSLDEAWTPAERDLLAACTDAIRQCNTGFRLFSDPGVKEGTADYDFDGIDILCPGTAFDEKTLDDYLAIDARRGEKGLAFGFYRCDPNTRELDPCMYFGGGFRYGFLFSDFFGGGFWQLSCADRTLNELQSQRIVRCPLYFKGDEVWSSKQWEAIYEAREDYEYLLRLKKLTARLHEADDPDADEGEELCQRARDLLLAEMANGNRLLPWNAPRDRGAFDRLRNEIWLFFEKKSDHALENIR